MDKKRLTDLFRKLGAPNPEGWAQVHLDEGKPQLARYLFLRQAWRLVVGPNDASWISERKNDMSGPGGEIGPALQRLLALGASDGDLSAIVRVMQWRLLAGLCLLLEDPGDLEDDVKNIAWCLFEMDDDEPIRPLDRLIESLLETDPGGREMRPKEEFERLTRLGHN